VGEVSTGSDRATALHNSKRDGRKPGNGPVVEESPGRYRFRY